MKFRGTTYTKRGAIQEMSATLARAKNDIDAVMQEFPAEAHGSAWLEEAIGLVGRVESELDIAADDASDPLDDATGQGRR